MDVQNLPEKLQMQLQCLETVGEFSHLLVSVAYDCKFGFIENMLKRLVSSLPDKDKRFKAASDVHLVIINFSSSILYLFAKYCII